MMRHIATVVIASLVLTAAATGCAHRANSFMPAAAVRSESVVPSGTWHGTLGGRDTGDAQGDELGTADLTITPDGRFTLSQTFAAMQGVNTMRATGTARVSRGRIILDGTIAAPESRKGEPFVASVRPHGNAFYGTTDVLYRGGKLVTIIELGPQA
jgi:hypothetical protein